MNKNGPVVVIDDDADDRMILEQVFRKLGYPNKLEFFNDADSAITFLKNPAVQPFIIISDINMPRINGFALREMVFNDPALRSKCIPYIFFTTSADEDATNRAYALGCQGIFQKPSSYNDVEKLMKEIMVYWMSCISPARF
ncbi:MAG: response regulator [Gemmatimonadaceae bacterium]|nr:response regulator [Chitinophagaceae bacterium]